MLIDYSVIPAGVQTQAGLPGPAGAFQGGHIGPV